MDPIIPLADHRRLPRLINPTALVGAASPSIAFARSASAPCISGSASDERVGRLLPQVVVLEDEAEAETSETASGKIEKRTW